MLKESLTQPRMLLVICEVSFVFSFSGQLSVWKETTNQTKKSKID